MIEPFQPESSPPKPEIFIIDDMPGEIDLLIGQLENDYRIKVATQASQALEYLKSPRLPNLILLDVIMPDMDGYTLCKMLKHDPHTRDIPIVFLTAATEENAECSGLSLGVVDYIYKPFNARIVKQRIKNHIERESLRRQLIQERDHLEEQVKLRTQSLQIAKETAELASQVKTMILGNLSHELRTPMNAIMGFVSLAKNLAVNPKQENYLQKTEIASRRLLTILENLLTLARLEQGRFSLNQTIFNLYELIQNCLKKIYPDAEMKGLKILLDMPDEEKSLALIGDSARLEQVIYELLSNAVKFSENGTITLKARQNVLADNDIQICIDVQDEGIGIAREDHIKLFRPFEQVDGSFTRQYGGNGIGLCLCAQLIDRMEGSIKAESPGEGQGSRFWFNVPLKFIVDQPFDRIDSQQADDLLIKSQLKGKRILIIEDDMIMQTALRDVLENNGLNVSLAQNYESALNLVRTEEFDLLIIDIMLPDGSGYDLALDIRQLPQFRNTPMIALTAKAFAQDAQESMDAGINVHLSKPIQAEQLLNTISEWLLHPPPEQYSI